MIDRAEFDQLVRDALANLYDFVALETHPLATLLSKSQDPAKSRAESLRECLLTAIQMLRPLYRETATGAVEWRPYLVLYGRYVEGLSLSELQTRLALSERQLRREHNRALHAVATLLWDQILFGQPPFEHLMEERGDDRSGESHLTTFDLTLEPLDLIEVTRGVLRTLQHRVHSEGTELRLVTPQAFLPVFADRVILRQILFSLLDYALDTRTEGIVIVSVEAHKNKVVLEIRSRIDPSLTSEIKDDSLEAARYWAQRLDATLQQAINQQSGLVRLVLNVPRADQPIVLVIDDQQAAVRMFRRYLSHTNWRVVGIQESTNVLPLVRQLQPQVITLDIMMPTIDGWEVLQALQADPETRHIPVVVCSVWDEPELAFSLGAAIFLKKPITQKNLLDALVRLELSDTLDESFLKDSRGLR